MRLIKVPSNIVLSYIHLLWYVMLSGDSRSCLEPVSKRGRGKPSTHISLLILLYSIVSQTTKEYWYLKRMSGSIKKSPWNVYLTVTEVVSGTFISLKKYIVGRDITFQYLYIGGYVLKFQWNNFIIYIQLLTWLNFHYNFHHHVKFFFKKVML